MSDFDQGGGSGVDEPGTSNPNRVAVFFYLRTKCSFLFLPRAESAEIDPFFTCAESAVFSFLTCAESAGIGPFLPAQKAQFSTAVLAVPSLLPVKKIAKDDVTQIHPIGAMVQGY